MNETELQAFSGEHLYYELEMVFFTAPLCIQYREPKDVDEQVIKNALLESFAIHVRVLKAFLFDPRGRLDDVISDDYVANLRRVAESSRTGTGDTQACFGSDRWRSGPSNDAATVRTGCKTLAAPGIAPGSYSASLPIHCNDTRRPARLEISHAGR